MESGKLWNFEEDEILIELVKNKPDLYDMQMPQYRDTNYKKKAWNEIEEVLGLSGAKTRWESLRSQYRKYLSKLKTKSGEASTKITKWRFHDQMAFLNEYLTVDISSISSIMDNENSSDNTKDLGSIKREIEGTQKQSINDNEEIELPNEFDNSFTNNTQTSSKIKIRPNQQENPSSTLMKYILQLEKKDPIDNFFLLMGSTVKKFSPLDQHFVKTKVFNLVSQVEEKYLISQSSFPSSGLNFPLASTSLSVPSLLQNDEANSTEDQRQSSLQKDNISERRLLKPKKKKIFQKNNKLI